MTWKRLVNCGKTELTKNKLVYIVAGEEHWHEGLQKIFEDTGEKIIQKLRVPVEILDYGTVVTIYNEVRKSALHRFYSP
jgi:hypothetical protein